MNENIDRPQKIKGIDGLRGIAAIIIIFYHFWANRSGDFLHGYLAVDFFFITSGFLLMRTCLKHKYKCGLDYLKHLIERCTPATTVILCAMFIYNGVRSGWPVMQYMNELPHLFYELLYMYILGISPDYYIYSVLWYIPVWMFLSYIFLNLYEYNEKMFLNLILPVIIVGCYSYIFAIWGNLGDFRSINRGSYFIKGVHRGAAGMGTGFLLYYLIPYLKNSVMKMKESILLLMEITVVMLLGVMILSKTDGISDVLVIPCSCYILSLCYMERGFLCKVMDLSVFRFLGGGENGIYLYMTQGFAISITLKLSKIFYDINRFEVFSFRVSLILVASSVICGMIFRYYFVPVIKKIVRFFALKNETT